MDPQPQPQPQPNPPASLWPVTNWSSLRQAAGAVGKDADRLERLILKYQHPLRVYLLSTFPALGSQVEEILQDFAEDKILRDGWLGKAQRDRGRFRDFLKRSLKHFVMDRLRGNIRQPTSLDALEQDPPAEPQGEQAFELTWARTLLGETLARMEKDCLSPTKNQPNRPLIWQVFRLRLSDPILEGSEPLAYRDLVARLGIASPFEAQNLLATAKRMFSRHLTAVISEYETGETAAKTEIEEIKQFLWRLSGK